MGLFGKNDEYVYVSFWPGDGKQKGKQKKSKTMSHSSSYYMPESYAEDVDEIERDADKIIMLRDFPNYHTEPLIYFRDRWETKSYSLTGVNCAYVVLENLKHMLGSFKSPIPVKWHGVLSPADVRCYGNILKRYY